MDNKIQRKIELLLSAHNRKIFEMITLRNKMLEERLKMLNRKHRKNMKKRMEENCKFFENILTNNLCTCISFKNKPVVWMKWRSREWWNKMYESTDLDEWIDNFRVDKDTYLFLCERLKNSLKAKENCVREPLSVEIKVAIALYKLASCAEYRVVANQFGVHKTSVHRCLVQVCTAINEVLLPEEIKMPTRDEMEVICNGFENFSKIPQVFGAIDGTHIPITPPAEGYRDYINRKCWPSLVLQGVVDYNYRFMNITIKHPGSTHDATVLKDSNLYKSIRNLDRPSKAINGQDIKAYLIGDPAYPLLDWLIKGYSLPATPEEESFNAYLSRARICVENAFGKLKSRWRILQKRIDSDVAMVPQIVAACCVLHNLIHKRRVPFRPQWTIQLDEANTMFPQPGRNASNIAEPSGVVIRNILTEYMAENFELRESRRSW